MSSTNKSEDGGENRGKRRRFEVKCYINNTLSKIYPTPIIED